MDWDSLCQILRKTINLANQTIEYAQESRGALYDEAKIEMVKALTDRLLAITKCKEYASHARVVAWEFDLFLARPRDEDRPYCLEDALEDVTRYLRIMTLLYPPTGENGRDVLLGASNLETELDLDNQMIALLLTRPPRNEEDHLGNMTLLSSPTGAILNLDAEISYCIEEWIENCDKGSPREWKSEVTLLRSCKFKEGESCVITEKVRAVRLFDLLKASWDHDPTTAVIVLRMMVDSRVFDCLVVTVLVQLLVRILREGPMVVRAEVASTIAKFVALDPKYQSNFSQHQLIRLLVEHITFEEDGEILEDTIYINKASSVLSTVMATYHLNRRKAAADKDMEQDKTLHRQGHGSSDQGTIISSDVESRMKAMAAKALGSLAKGNSSVCHTLCEMRALICFARMLEKGTKDVKYNSAAALMEITAVAEQDSDLRRSFFRPGSLAYKAVVGQLVKTIESFFISSRILLPSITAIGNLARTFRDMQAIIPMVKLLRTRKSEEWCKEVLSALVKFTCRDNFMHADNSKAIIRAGGLKELVAKAHAEEIEVSKPALLLLCCIVLDVLDRECHDAIPTIIFASQKGYVAKDQALQALVQDVKRRFG